MYRLRHYEPVPRNLLGWETFRTHESQIPKIDHEAEILSVCQMHKRDESSYKD